MDLAHEVRRTDFAELGVDETAERLRTDPAKGLSSEEAQRRREELGPNAIEEEKRSSLLVLLSHFWGPIPWMLEIAAVLGLVAQRWEEFGVIVTMLLINGGVSYWHESRADEAIEALKEKLAPRARVLRDGERETVDAKELVPGDRLLLRMGDVVPADAKIVEGELSVDESTLTGESLPVSKEEGDLLFSGTTVSRGEAPALATATGSDTRFARTVQLVEEAGQASHFQQAVLRIGTFLIGSTLALVAVVLGVGWWRGDPWVDLVMFALVLTIAGIPQALPAVLTVTMTVGASRLADMKAIVSRLAAMEEMAGLDVLCADKTGTLTKNELELQDPVVLAAEDARDLVRAAALTARGEGEDPIDHAILQGLDDAAELSAYTVTDFRPFDPTRKRAEASVEHEGRRFAVAKGAPQVILDLVAPDEEERRRVATKVDELAEAGYRALGVARKEEGRGWRYLGLLPLLDPPREDTAEVLAQARRHHIDVRMVTGDHAAIARQVAGQVGLGQRIRDAGALFPHGGEGGERERLGIDEEVLASDGFAQVTPEHKYQLVRAFQRRDHITGMTGDGVNDAPALQQADVGVAVSAATDAARAASDLVLTRPGLGVITRAVEEARRIFERMTSYATYRIAESARMVLFIALSILAFDFYPVTPIMLILLAILNDIPIMTIATDNAVTPDRPVRWNMRRVLAIASVLGVAGVLSTYLLFAYAEAFLDVPRETLQTMLFLKLLVAGHMTIFLTRNEGWLWERPWPSLPLLLGLEGTQVAGTLVAVYGVLVAPIGWGYALGIWGYSLLWLLVNNGAKLLAHRALGRSTRRPEAGEPDPPRA